MAIYKAETLCARAEYSQAEIMKKLIGWGLPRDRAAEVVDGLVEAGFIDDCRFARAYVSDKIEFARWGVRKIYVSLRAKGIDHETIKEALEEVDGDLYEQNMIDLIKSKGKSIEDAFTYEGKTKILRFMLSRGYESGSVIKLLNDRSLWVEE